VVWHDAGCCCFLVMGIVMVMVVMVNSARCCFPYWQAVVTRAGWCCLPSFVPFFSTARGSPCCRARLYPLLLLPSQNQASRPVWCCSLPHVMSSTPSCPFPCVSRNPQAAPSQQAAQPRPS